MSRWLQAARLPDVALTKPTKPTEPSGLAVVSVKSVLSATVEPFFASASPDLRVAPIARLAHCDASKSAIQASDPGTLLALLHRDGPTSYGAAATVLGWGATRAWQAEARLRAAGLVRYDEFGRAHPTSERPNP